MPSFDANTDAFSEHFIFFKPRNIISGDFYLTKDLGDHIVIIAADCTGHGIPGAFMSMLGISLLNQIVVQDRITSPDIILNKLRDKVVSTFMQDDNADTRKDGMDVSLCVIDKRNETMEFAGAYNSMLLFTDGELVEIGGNRMPVGMHPKMCELFAKQTFSIKKGMCFYLLSDGYTDQFGGPEGKKFRKKQFKELLSSIQTKKMDEQKQILENTYYLWKGNEDQVDDVLVIGVRI